MTIEPFDAVLAEARDLFAHDQRYQDLLGERFDRLAAAHAAEVGERDAHYAELEAMHVQQAANIVAAIKRAEATERDARRWQAMREHMVAVDWKPEMGGGPVVMFECLAERIMAGPEGADAIADAAIEFAAIAACMGEK